MTDKRILFVSLGCDKNLVDSEYMLAKLADASFVITDDEALADVIVINTCCFILDAKEESIETILAMAQHKHEGSLKALIVCGCMAERYRDEIIREIPEVDAVIGTNATEEIVTAVKEALSGKGYSCFHPLTAIEEHPAGRMVSTGGHYAYLKVAEGCDKHCTYCIIPSLRGRYRSVPMSVLLSEAEKLAADGVSELILVAQETTVYGQDLYGKKMLPALLDQLQMIDGICWIRLLYCYPEEIDDDLIDAIIRNSKVCHYLDMPIQHISTDLLKRMGRRTTREELTEKIARLRLRIPDIALRTSIICGFPGETQEMHEELLAFLEDAQFDRLGAFAYSQEEETPAADFPDQIPEDVKHNRVSDVMTLSKEIIAAKNEMLNGSVQHTVIEGWLADEDIYLGRTYRDTPGVDGYVFINSPRGLTSGEYADVKITGAYEYDLIGELI